MMSLMYTGQTWNMYTISGLYYIIQSEAIMGSHTINSANNTQD